MTPKECIEELERYIETKYADLMELHEEMPFPSKKVQRIMGKIEDSMSIAKLGQLSQKLYMHDKNVLCAELRLYVSNEIGNLIETYRYESIEEGERYEEYLDSLLEIAETLITKEPISYPAMPYMQVAEYRQ